MKKNNLRKTIAVMMAIGLTFTLAGAGCGSNYQISPTPLPSPQTTTPTTSTTTTGAKQISMTSSMLFSPANLTVTAGQTITWTNNGSAPHTVTADISKWLTAGLDSDKSFANGMTKSQSWSWKVPAGTPSGTKIYYHCRLHGSAGDGSSLGGGMAGVITVS